MMGYLNKFSNYLFMLSRMDRVLLFDTHYVLKTSILYTQLAMYTICSSITAPCLIRVFVKFRCTIYSYKIAFSFDWLLQKNVKLKHKM